MGGSAWMPLALRAEALPSALGLALPGRNSTEFRLMLVLIGPGHSTDAVMGLLRVRRSRSTVDMRATTPNFATL